MINTGILHKLPLTAVIHVPLFTCFNKNSIILSLCIFETSVIFEIYVSTAAEMIVSGVSTSKTIRNALIQFTVYKWAYAR